MGNASASPTTVAELTAAATGAIDAAADDETSLVQRALDTLAATHHPLTYLAILHVSKPLPALAPATQRYLASSCAGSGAPSGSYDCLHDSAAGGLRELEITDVSASLAASYGTASLLRPAPQYPPSASAWTTAHSDIAAGSAAVPLAVMSTADQLRERGAAIVRQAVGLPSLRRLSLSSAVFAAADVAALAALTQLERLAVAGAMECSSHAVATVAPSAAASSYSLDAIADVDGGGATDANAAVLKLLLCSLPQLRQLALPMALRPPSSSYGKNHPRLSYGYDSSDDDECGEWDAVSDDWDAAASLFGVHGSSSGGGNSCCGSGNFCGGGRLGEDSAPASSDDGSCDGVGIGVGTPEVQPADLFSTGHKAPVPSPPPSYSTSPSFTAAPQPSANTGYPSGGDCRTAADCRTTDWRFPPLLEELTLPVCALNGSVFRALCDAYGNDDVSAGGKPSGGGGGAGVGLAPKLRALRVICVAGYTPWEGSFLKTVRDFAALARLASLESLHLDLDLDLPLAGRTTSHAGAASRSHIRPHGGRGLGRDALCACFQQLTSLRRLKDIRVGPTRQPTCFAPRPKAALAPAGAETGASLLSYIMSSATSGDECHLPYNLRGQPPPHLASTRPPEDLFSLGMSSLVLSSSPPLLPPTPEQREAAPLAASTCTASSCCGSAPGSASGTAAMDASSPPLLPRPLPVMMTAAAATAAAAAPLLVPLAPPLPSPRPSPARPLFMPLPPPMEPRASASPPSSSVSWPPSLLFTGAAASAGTAAVAAPGASAARPLFTPPLPALRSHSQPQQHQPQPRPLQQQPLLRPLQLPYASPQQQQHATAGGLSLAGIDTTAASTGASFEAISAAAGSAAADGSETKPGPNDPVLELLLLRWPQLQSLVFFGYLVLRSLKSTEAESRDCCGGASYRLVSPSSLDELVQLRACTALASSPSAIGDEEVRTPATAAVAAVAGEVSKLGKVEGAGGRGWGLHRSPPLEIRRGPSTGTGIGTSTSVARFGKLPAAVGVVAKDAAVVGWSRG